MGCGASKKNEPPAEAKKYEPPADPATTDAERPAVAESVPKARRSAVSLFSKRRRTPDQEEGMLRRAAGRPSGAAS